MLSPRDVAVVPGPPAGARVSHHSSTCLEKTCSEAVCVRTMKAIPCIYGATQLLPGLVMGVVYGTF